MVYAPLPDMGWAPILYVMGGVTLLYSFPVIVGVESLIFKFFLGSRFLRAVGLAFTVNLISGLVGVVWLLLGLSYLLRRVMACEDCGCSYYEICQAAEDGILFSILVYLVLTVIIEGFAVLNIKTGVSWVRCMAAVLFANLVSYGLIALYLFVDDVHLIIHRFWMRVWYFLFY